MTLWDVKSHPKAGDHPPETVSETTGMLNKHEMERVVCAALKESGHGDTLRVVEVMPEIETIVLRCEEHGPFTLSWQSFLGRPTRGKPGRRCPTCEERVRNSGPTFCEVVARAAAYGYAPDFRDADFTDTQGLLAWRCLKHVNHRRVCHIGQLDTNGCPDCKTEERQQRRLELLQKWAGKVGDTILSTAEQCASDEALIDFRCGNCGVIVQKSASALLQGHGHSCRARKRRRLLMQARHAALAQQAKQLGITIVSPPHLYTGSKSNLRIKEEGQTRSRRVSHHQLARMLKEREAEREARRRKKPNTVSKPNSRVRAAMQPARISH